MRTPLVRLDASSPRRRVWLKLENLQPIGSFKIRGAAQRRCALRRREALARGVYTASAGNMAQGVAWNARALGVPCDVVVPDHAPRDQARRDRARLGAHVDQGAVRPLVAGDRSEHRYDGLDGPLRPSGERSGGDRRQRHDRRSRSSRTFPTWTRSWSRTAAAA